LLFINFIYNSTNYLTKFSNYLREDEDKDAILLLAQPIVERASKKD
jgi:hypothetical protein